MNPTTPMTSSAGEPRVARSTRPSSAGDDVEHRRQRGHLAERHEPVLDDPRAAAELRRRDVRVVGALDRVEDVVGDVQPELDERRTDRRSATAVTRSNAAVARRDQDAEEDRARSSPSGTAGASRAASASPSDRRGLTGVPRSAESASKYRRDWPTDRSEYSKNGTSASSQPQAVSAGEGQRPVIVSFGRRATRAPDRDVAALVVAIARLRPDVRAGQGDSRVGRDGQAGRRSERGRAGRGVDRRPRRRR